MTDAISATPGQRKEGMTNDPALAITAAHAAMGQCENCQAARAPGCTKSSNLPPSYLGGSLVSNATTGECVVRMHFGNAKEAERWFDAATDSCEAAQKAAPEGWVLVPAKPTREWIGAVADDGYADCDVAQLIASILSNAPAAPAAEALAQHIDTLDNLAGALKLPMPANMHVAALREQLPALVRSMRTDFAAATGNNPWDTHHDQ